MSAEGKRECIAFYFAQTESYSELEERFQAVYKVNQRVKILVQKQKYLKKKNTFFTCWNNIDGGHKCQIRKSWMWFSWHSQQYCCHWIIDVFDAVVVVVVFCRGCHSERTCMKDLVTVLHRLLFWCNLSLNPGPERLIRRTGSLPGWPVWCGATVYLFIYFLELFFY